MNAERNAKLIEQLEQTPGVICKMAADELRHLNVVILKLRDAIERAGLKVVETPGDWTLATASERTVEQ